MKYVVGLCGAHGTGKSSILQGVKNAGYDVDESQLSRAVQEELGWSSLEEAGSSVENLWLLQEGILSAMVERDDQINSSQLFTLVDRTPADVWAYTEYWLGRLGIDHEADIAAVLFRERCKARAEEYAMFLYVPINEVVSFVAESKRADLQSRERIAAMINCFLWVNDCKRMYVGFKSSELNDRISEVIIITTTIIKTSYGAVSVKRKSENSTSRAFGVLVGVTIAKVDASCVNELVLTDRNGVSYQIMAENGPLNIPTLTIEIKS